MIHLLLLLQVFKWEHWLGLELPSIVYNCENLIEYYALLITFWLMMNFHTNNCDLIIYYVDFFFLSIILA